MRACWKRKLINIIKLTVFFSILSCIAHMLCTIYYPIIKYFLHFYLAAAGITGFLYILLKGIRFWRKNLISAIQIVLIFSTLPYIPFNVLFNPLDAFVFLAFPGVVLFVIITILPECFSIIGLAFLKHCKLVLATIFLALAAASVFEIYPLRTSWRFDFNEPVIRRLYNLEDNRAFCTSDREIEIKRSIQTIMKLEAQSKNSPVGNTARVRFAVPDLNYRPDMLKLHQDWQWSPYEYWDDANHPAFIEKVVNIDTTIDSDNDGLIDLKEIILFSDAYNMDTDGDGVHDGDDSDPLNTMIESEIGELNAAIIEYDMSSRWYAEEGKPWFCDVDNYFYRGKGEVANFGKHILIMNGDHQHLWYKMFNDVFEHGIFNHSPPDIHIGRQAMDILGMIALVDFSTSGGGGILLLVKWHYKWQVIAERCLWI